MSEGEGQGLNPTETRFPLVVDESLEYMRTVALSQVDMDSPPPSFEDTPEEATAVQIETLLKSIIDLRTQTLLRGKETKMKDGRTVFKLQNGQYDIYSSDPQQDPKIAKTKVFWIARFGRNNEPDIYFNYFVERDGHKFDLQANFGSAPNDPEEAVIYDSGKRKRDVMDRHEYNVASYVLEEAMKLEGPKHK